MIYDALIIGGGPAGATAALLLARAGWSVALTEKKRFPRAKVCGEFISATSLPLLRELGVAGAFHAAAGPDVRRVGFFAGEMTLDAPMPAHASVLRLAMHDESFGRALGREHLDTLLLDAAWRAGAIVYQPYAAQSLRCDGGVHLCAIANHAGEIELAAPIVIAAHGSWETGVLPTQAAYPHQASNLLAFKAHFHNAALPPDLMPLLVFPGGYGGMVASDAGRVSLSCCIRRDCLADCRREHPGIPAGEAVLSHIRASARGVDDVLRDASLESAWLAAGPIRPGIRLRADDQVFLVGNAAGEAHPIVAEGISMAMQSAALLAAQLLAAPQARASAGARREIAARYARTWNSAFAPRIRAAALFAQGLMRPAGAALAGRILSRFPNLLTVSARIAGKTRPIPQNALQTLANAG